jgi:hypothetical protein
LICLAYIHEIDLTHCTWPDPYHSLSLPPPFFTRSGRESSRDAHGEASREITGINLAAGKLPETAALLLEGTAGFMSP